jgi:hypothetical protein
LLAVTNGIMESIDGGRGIGTARLQLKLMIQRFLDVDFKGDDIADPI